MKNTLVIGASAKPWRYSFQALLRLKAAGHKVLALGKQEGTIADEPIFTQKENLPPFTPDTITLYLNADHQREMYDWLIGLSPKRIIFNPGAENPEFEQLLSETDITHVRACTLVMLSTGQY